jgi:hypothetical protein
LPIIGTSFGNSHAVFRDSWDNIIIGMSEHSFSVRGVFKTIVILIFEFFDFHLLFQFKLLHTLLPHDIIYFSLQFRNNKIFLGLHMVESIMALCVMMTPMHWKRSHLAVASRGTSSLSPMALSEPKSYQCKNRHYSKSPYADS